MADTPVIVQPGGLLSAASTVAGHLERSAAPPPAAAVRITAPGSPVDAATGSVAAGMQTKMTALSGQLAGKGPELQATTTAGATALQAQDAQNAAAIGALRAADIGGNLKGLGGGASVQSAGFGIGGKPPLDPPKLPKFPLDLSAIQRLAPGAPGPYGYMELVPGSGVWVPDPSVNALHPGSVGPTAQGPLDLGSIVRLAPGALGPTGYMELVPHSGVWVADPTSPGFMPAPPKFPLDLGSIVRLAPSALGPPGYMELVPHSGVWVPDPGAPH